MPYIKQENRRNYEKELMDLINKLSIENNEGDYNYIITRLIHNFVQKNGLNYKNLNAAVGILECAKLEFVRRVVSPYEDRKINENGDVRFFI